MKNEHMKMVTKRRGIVALAIVLVAAIAISVTQLVSASTPAEDAVIAKAMSSLTDKGVPVGSWSLDGATLLVTLQSASSTDVGTPDDQISISLVQREAFLAKSRGVALSSLQLTVNNALGKTLFGGNMPLDKKLDAAWSVEPAQNEADAAAAVKTTLFGAKDLSGLAVGKLQVTSDSGVRELSIDVTAADITEANLSTAALMLSVYNTVNHLNADKGAQIALTHVRITDKAGAPLLNWLYDAQRGSQDWWQAPGMTTDWFEGPPGTTAPPAAASAAAD
jgi:hypothetical protein